MAVPVASSASIYGHSVVDTAFPGTSRSPLLSHHRPAGQTGVFKLLQTTLYFDLTRSNAFFLLHTSMNDDPEQTAVLNPPV